MSSVEKLSCAATVTHLIRKDGEINLGGVCFNLPTSHVALSRLSSCVCHAVSFYVIHCAALYSVFPCHNAKSIKVQSNKNIFLI